MSKEAMKLALEGAANYIDALGGDSRKYRQALANEALDKMAENARELGLDYEPAQQEPFTHYRHYDNGLQDWADEKTIPLYTSPPAQRKPLTDEEIIKCWGQVSGTRYGYVAFARAIEAAHNIKENT